MTTSAPRHLDIHILHTLPYSNLNRDDLGSPKSLLFGGTPRTRVSSQCWKRAVRLAVESGVGESAVRTRRLPVEVAGALVGEHGWPVDIAEFAGRHVAAAAGLGVDKDDLTVLVFLPARAVVDLVELCVAHRDDLNTALVALRGRTRPQPKKGESVLPSATVKELIGGRNSITALFGRMLAELPESKVDGAVQLAHAFTTHATEPEIDFFTAVDDLNPIEATGGGHLNTAEFSSGVFYRYASLNLADLSTNLGGDQAKVSAVTEAFVSSFLSAMPNAKKTSTAPFTVPDLAYVAARADRPVSLAAAFEDAVSLRDGAGFAKASRRRLDSYNGKIAMLLGEGEVAFHGHATLDDDVFPALGARQSSYPGLVAEALDAVNGVER
ncbi:type I-E CRISPR-associated protein Cas7/Cse4/CasC [Actinoalloteichus hymeniacidonis]|uniref:CRISPR-associated protein Cas7/Cse4/CasC, subtype I-E/ECOLI n=1 Tax=Actinoalloteichus hymeniacidonis TaxID=340345 RepID=A0AAC9HST3_9PSEU|nr:type I-E CRISPR-associated protein Cas7/Cse4/CasC [Actinoalloteichus hymeniacidonis]AOS64818.1 CRISPR-associated protein Cas7/Cse4/CasC, subtype I-E/ECOLI [Actinoalloteichus hymeniacidonis]MBB5907107.1 CRISPR system Cascade subunit CasC [Actinoalloteichus hymeniacidonis]